MAENWPQAGDPDVAEDPQVTLDTSVAHPARVYDYWLGGKDNFAADREAAEQVIAANPHVLPGVRANRAFLGRAVMRAQLQHLAEVASLPNVTLQVAPFGGGGHAAAGGSFSIVRFAEPDLPDIVYIEQLTSALYLSDRAEVDHYLEVMNDLSGQALTPARSARFLADLTREA